MQLKGTVSSIVYYNAQNGYTVMSLNCGGKEYTCVGNLPVIAVGENLTINGTVTMHNKYGEQVNVESYVIDTPHSREGVVRYLSNGLIKGVGEKTAEKIYARFGEKSMEIIEKEPSRLQEISGISVNKAAEIANSYREIKKMQMQILYLQQYSITVNTAIKIYNAYGDATKDIVSSNPYRLIDDVDGIGFITADKIARNMGIEEWSPFRIRAAVVYCLKESADKQGNTFVSMLDLKASCTSLLGLDLDNELASVWEDVIGRLTLDVTIRVFDVGATQSVSLARYYNMEKSVADKLLRLNSGDFALPDCNDLIAEFERSQKIELHESQKQAVAACLSNGVTVITGGPGTGKTTIIKCITHVLGKYGKALELCAPTGRASKRLAEASGLPAKTIHRMLGLSFATGTLSFTYDQYNPLPADVVIVDEVSMVDVGVMFSLLRALKDGTRLILVGDKDQLPSVGAGNVLADIIASGVIDIKYLTHIYRQEEGSLIINNAHLINQCRMPTINNASKDFFFIARNSQEEVLQECLDLVSTRLPKWIGKNSKEIQLLGALKSGVAGVNNCNRQLQALLNPPSGGKRQLVMGDTVFRVGDRVMQTVNDYELEWERFSISGNEQSMGVFNGDIGEIIEVNNFSGSLIVKFDDDRVAQYNTMQIANLMLAYAITIHKSQGSEFDCVVIPLVGGAPTILNKNLLYTAVTRAKKVVVLVCSKKVLSMVVHNNYIAQRTTLLCTFLREEKSKYETILN